MSSQEGFRKLLRVFVACPGDVEDEKERLGKVIESLQFDADQQGFVLRKLEWRQCVPDLGPPQDVIFRQVNPEAWDIFIAILWTRFGTPCGIFEPGTNRELTGTEAEILKAIEMHKARGRPRVLVYRSTRPPKSLKDVQGAQLEAIDDFLQNCDAKGKHPALVKLYQQPDEFERLLSEHLRKTLATVELEEVKRTQEVQQDHLNIMQLVLPLLLPKQEQQHLINLELGKTSGYRGSHSVRTELRRLRSMGLLEKHPSRNIGDINDNVTVNLSDYVYLTANGKEWVKIIRENEKMLAKDQRKDQD
jgi:hypothetical protein